MNPAQNDDIIVTPAVGRKFRMIVRDIYDFGPFALVNGPELRLDGTSTARNRSMVRMDLVTWEIA